MKTDGSAPVRESGEIVIAARPELVWDMLTDLASWPGWMPGVTRVRVEGPARVGTKFEWKAGPGTIRSEILEADRPRSVGWRGRTFGTTALHVWLMEDHGDGTRVVTEESWRGVLPRVLRSLMRRTVRKALDDGLPALKREAEERARAVS